MLYRWEVQWVDGTPVKEIDTERPEPLLMPSGWIKVLDQLGVLHTINGEHVRTITTTQLQEQSPSSRRADGHS